MTRKPWKVGDIVQIEPEHDEVFGGCLMIVTEPKPWGAKGYFDVPGKGHAYYRVEHENARFVGVATWVYEVDEDE